MVPAWHTGSVQQISKKSLRKEKEIKENEKQERKKRLKKGKNGWERLEREVEGMNPYYALSTGGFLLLYLH